MIIWIILNKMLNVDEKKIDNKKDIKEIEKVFPNKKQVNKKKKCIIF